MGKGDNAGRGHSVRRSMKPSPRDLADLADEPLERSAGSFDERFDELARVAYRVAFRIVGQREEAHDITQEALTRAYCRWPHIEDRAAAWVGRVSTNLALDHVRRRRRPRVQRSEPHRDLSAHAGERADLVTALRRLSRRQRDVVVLRYLADLPEAEVAAVLGCGVGTVKSHAHRGLAALRTLLGPASVGGKHGSAPPPAGPLHLSTPGAYPADPSRGGR
jgi:RNA polymerase sigma-70 factor (sigma-E family)